MEDRTLSCADCGEDFVFSVAEQEFFAEQGFTNAPKRCVRCRRQRKAGRRPAPRGDGPPARTDRPPRPEGPRTVRVRRVRGDAPTTHREARAQQPAGRETRWHKTTCSSCGCDTEVPFQPDGVRPVFCMPCLKQQTR